MTSCSRIKDEVLGARDKEGIRVYAILALILFIIVLVVIGLVLSLAQTLLDGHYNLDKGEIPQLLWGSSSLWSSGWSSSTLSRASSASRG